MDKIKKWYRSIPIWLALFLFIIAALLIASFLSNKITSMVYDLNMGITAKYITVNYDVMSDGDDVIYNTGDTAEIVKYNFNYDQYTDQDWRLHEIYSFIQRFTKGSFSTSFLLTMGWGPPSWVSTRGMS